PIGQPSENTARESTQEHARESMQSPADTHASSHEQPGHADNHSRRGAAEMPVAPAETEIAPPSPAPRRRSTVREPAPVGLSGEHADHELTPAAAVVQAPLPQSISPEPAASAEPERPRRSGWWSRRVLGKG